MRIVDRRQKLIRFLGVAAGGAAVIVTFIPPFSTNVSPELARGMSGIAAALLIADGIWPSLFSDSAHRFEDYAFYVGQWAHSIRETLVEQGLDVLG